MQNADKRFLAKRQRREEFRNELYDLTANDVKIANKIKNIAALVFLVDECIADTEFKNFLAKTQRREELKNDLYNLTANDAKIANKTK
jgi:hypothetical protein